MQVTVDKGEITVSNHPSFPGVVLSACGQVTCAAVKVKGANLAALKERATTLGFSNMGRRKGDKCTPEQLDPSQRSWAKNPGGPPSRGQRIKDVKAKYQVAKDTKKEAKAAKAVAAESGGLEDTKTGAGIHRV